PQRGTRDASRGQDQSWAARSVPCKCGATCAPLGRGASFRPYPRLKPGATVRVPLRGTERSGALKNGTSVLSKSLSRTWTQLRDLEVIDWPHRPCLRDFWYRCLASRRSARGRVLQGVGRTFPGRPG
ncbi:MAG: hypothetical protein WCL71_17030, partial [Deltaproteobacteria bacterium]